MNNIATESDWQPVLVAFSNNDFNKVLTLSENLIEKFPNFAFAYKAKGVALYKLNDSENSIVYLTKAYELDKNDLDIINNLTTALSRSNEKDNWMFSKEILENSIYNKKICDIKTYFNLLVSIGRLGEWDNIVKLSTAILNFIQNNNNAGLSNSEIYEIYSLLTQTMLRQEKYDEAKKFAYLMKKYNKTDESDIYIAQCLIDKNKYIDAISFLEQANRKYPNNFKLLLLLASTLKSIGEADFAISILNKVEEIFILKCDNSVEKINLDDKISIYCKFINFMHYSTRTNIHILQQYICKYSNLIKLKYKNSHKFNFEYMKKLSKENKITALNIGLVSGDFNSHVVSLFIRNLIPCFKKQSINIYIYMNRNFEDNVSEELKKYCKKWTRIFDLTDEETADKIYNDKIHILIDLSGYTKYSRLPVFALKPAPIQISWIGWFGTTGIPTMDYFIADEFCVPSGGKYEQQFSEKVLRMPNIWEVLTPPNTENLPPPPPRKIILVLFLQVLIIRAKSIPKRWIYGVKF